MKVLAGDIGGTKTLLQIADVTADHYQVIYEQRFESQRYDDFLAMAQSFLGSAPHAAVAAIEGACIAVAGPVDTTKAGQQASVTNLPWHIEARPLAATLHLPRLLLINDFQAIGYGIGALISDDLVVLQSGQLQPRAPRMIIGAGTGLGVAQMIWQAGRYQVIPSEGGHIDFAPADEQQMALLRYMQRSFDHVSYDRILSGPGLAQIYAFLQEAAGAGASAQHPLLQRDDPAAAISAAVGEDPVARVALEMFISIYGAQAGNLALLNLAFGGVYLAGGIAPKIINHLAAGGFIKAFASKGRMANLMTGIPVAVIAHPKVGVMGAARTAAGI